MKRRTIKDVVQIRNGQKYRILSTPQAILQVAIKSPHAYGRNSIIGINTHQGFKRQGHAMALIEAAKRRFDNLSAQCSNLISVRLFLKAGFKPYFKKNATWDEIEKEWSKAESLLMIWRRQTQRFS